MGIICSKCQSCQKVCMYIFVLRRVYFRNSHVCLFVDLYSTDEYQINAKSYFSLQDFKYCANGDMIK